MNAYLAVRASATSESTLTGQFRRTIIFVTVLLALVAETLALRGHRHVRR